MLSDDIEASDLAGEVRAELLSLAKPVADTVARHLVATGKLIDEDPEEALAHAVAARRLASRISAVREAVGLAAYHAGEWQTAIAELRTYHRMSGTQTHLAVVADSERALGRPERAIDLFRAADRTTMDPADAVELLIVAAGARGDLGQKDAAVAMLQVRELTVDPAEPWTARLRYAYADTLLAVDRRDEAREWFARAAEVDEDSVTDAAERLLELDGVVLEGDEADDDEDEPGYDAVADQDVIDDEADEDDEVDEDEFDEGEAAYDEVADEDNADDADDADDADEDTIADADASGADAEDVDAEDADAAFDDEVDEDGDGADEEGVDAVVAAEADEDDVDADEDRDEVVNVEAAGGDAVQEDVVEDKVAEDEFAYAAEDEDDEKLAGDEPKGSDDGEGVKTGKTDES